MNVLKITASAVALTLTGSAFAADLPSRRAPAPYLPPPPVFTWTGFYVGANAGGTVSSSNSITTVGVPTYANTATFGAVASAISTADASAATNIVALGRRSGAVLGVQAGYNYQFTTSFLLGFEADIQGILSGSQQRGLLNAAPIDATGFSTIAYGSVNKRLDYLGTARGRLGFLVTPSLLIYATGGLAYGGVKSQTNIAEFVNNGGGGVSIFGASGGISTNKVGYSAGGGLEWMFSPSFSLKAEYLYYNLGTTRYTPGAFISNPTGTAGVVSTEGLLSRVRYDGHIGRVGVNYHFWSPVAAPVVARY